MLEFSWSTASWILWNGGAYGGSGDCTRRSTTVESEHTLRLPTVQNSHIQGIGSTCFLALDTTVVPLSTLGPDRCYMIVAIMRMWKVEFAPLTISLDAYELFWLGRDNMANENATVLSVQTDIQKY
ncbi:hypothetical protein ABKN59_006987 [Abortiporus biennis]